MAILAAPIASGCYSYRATDVDSLSPDEDVRLRVRPVEDPTGLGDAGVRSVEGTLVEVDGETVVVGRLREFWAESGYQSGRQSLRLPRDRILSVEEKTLSAWKTAALAGGAAGAAAILVLTLGGDGDGGGPGPGPGPGPGISVGFPIALPFP